MSDDQPDCEVCNDTGILEMGKDVQSTTFCKCDKGEEVFIAWADGQSEQEMDPCFGME